ncbi:MAG TPA: hypothetical protein VNW94_00335 [Streptosporangiaceae bacterium]|nr:hypothetical protein [Streptosporangiaceae bacterium]
MSRGVSRTVSPIGAGNATTQRGGGPTDAAGPFGGYATFSEEPLEELLDDDDDEEEEESDEAAGFESEDEEDEEDEAVASVFLSEAFAVTVEAALPDPRLSVR